MNIRNKFAHVKMVDSFDNLFEVAGNGTQIKNQLEKYSLEDKKDEDDKYKFLFFKLSEEITKMLFDLQVKERLEKNVLQIEKDFQKGHLESFKEVVAESEIAEELNAEVHKRTVKKLPHLRIENKKTKL